MLCFFFWLKSGCVLRICGVSSDVCSSDLVPFASCNIGIQALYLVQVRTFIVASEEFAFRRAAARLGIDAPNVSRRIAALEAELGVQLFERISGGVRLTEDRKSTRLNSSH